jgi:hypothetical protein
VNSRLANAETDRDFIDPILCGLLKAQIAWLVTRDPAAVRRELVQVLAALG